MENNRVLNQQEIDELIRNYRGGSVKEATAINEIIYRKGAEQLRNHLTQAEIDELFEKFCAGQSIERTAPVYEVLQRGMKKFKHDEAYTVEDYDLFYCKYALEKLTSCASMLRRYAYGDNESFKGFKYFIVLEEYLREGINAVLVAGTPSKEQLESGDTFRECQENGITYLVDASSLNYAFNIDV